MARKVVKDVVEEEKKVKAKVGRKKTTSKDKDKSTTKVSKTTKSTEKKTASKSKKSTTSAKKVSPKIDKLVSEENSKKSKKVTKSTVKRVKAANSTDKTSSAKKSATSKRSTSKSKQDMITAKPMLPEYYDLPYRYNETVVKILAQTPTTLFVYWDISDSDRNSLISMYDENFFYETRPILVVHNVTKNYSFEIEINDFANSWYIRTQEPNCNYIIELGRRFNRQDSKYVYIDSSNSMISPNDHVLFEKANLGNVLFRNVKTNKLSSKDFGSLRFINNIDKLYGNIYDVYSALYDDDMLNDFSNPSSGEFNFKK